MHRSEVALTCEPAGQMPGCHHLKSALGTPALTQSKTIDYKEQGIDRYSCGWFDALYIYQNTLHPGASGIEMAAVADPWAACPWQVVDLRGSYGN